MREGYHPEIDFTPWCSEEFYSKYRSIVGWSFLITVLLRFNISYTTSAMSSFNMLPREGHLKAAKIVLAYLKKFSKGRIIVDAKLSNHPNYCNEDHSYWKSFYLDAEEETRSGLSKSNF
jgi:hypothetical protein